MTLKYFKTERVLPCNVSQLFIASSRCQFRFLVSMEEDDWSKGLCYRILWALWMDFSWASVDLYSPLSDFDLFTAEGSVIALSLELNWTSQMCIRVIWLMGWTDANKMSLSIFEICLQNNFLFFLFFFSIFVCCEYDPLCTRAQGFLFLWD